VKKIRVFLDYKCYPLWVYNEKGELISNDIVEELLNETEIKDLLKDIQNTYNSLFIDNEVLFEYKGFNNKEERRTFLDKVEHLMQMIRSKVGDSYIIENEVNI